MQDILAIALPLVALVWLALREVAPKTSNEVDDKVLAALDAVGERLGVSPGDLQARMRSSESKRKAIRANGD